MANDARAGIAGRFVPVLGALVLGTLWAASPARLAAAVPVQGDLQALQLIRDVQAANLTVFPTGFASFRAERSSRVNSSSGGPGEQATFTRTCEGTIVWDGDRSFWDAAFAYKIVSDAGKLESHEDPHSAVSIESSREHFSFNKNPERPRARRQFGDFTHREIDYPIIPQQGWYGPDVPQVDFKWDFYFNVDREWKGLKVVTVERRGDDEIVFTRYGKNGEPPHVVTSSLKAGGNVIRSEQAWWNDAPPKHNQYGETINYSWVPLPDGRFRLQSMSSTVGPPDGPLESTCKLEIREFDPAPKIPANRFRFESFQIPQGTEIVEEKNGVRTETVFGKPRPRVTPPITTLLLEELADKARSEGFARPKP